MKNKHLTSKNYYDENIISFKKCKLLIALKTFQKNLFYEFIAKFLTVMKSREKYLSTQL